MTGSTSLREPSIRQQLEIVEQLARSAICAGLNSDDVTELAATAELRRYRALQEAVVEGIIPCEINVVASGRFIVLLPSEQLDRQGANAVVNLHSFVPGDCFGQAGLVEDIAAPASIIASESSQTVSIPIADVIRFLQKDQHRCATVYRNLFAIQMARSKALAA